VHTYVYLSIFLCLPGCSAAARRPDRRAHVREDTSIFISIDLSDLSIWLSSIYLSSTRAPRRRPMTHPSCTRTIGDLYLYIYLYIYRFIYLLIYLSGYLLPGRGAAARGPVCRAHVREDISIFYFYLSYHTTQQQSADSRNSAGAEALAVARRPSIDLSIF